jgi:hypothetical protein
VRWLRKALHRCDPPDFYPVTEDQRYWVCPDCDRVWRWDVIEPEGIGWVRHV